MIYIFGEKQQGPCRFKEDLSVVNITSWAVLPARDEKVLEAAVATIGPIAASINASPKTFQLYQWVYSFLLFRQTSEFLCEKTNIWNFLLLIIYEL